MEIRRGFPFCNPQMGDMLPVCVESLETAVLKEDIYFRKEKIGLFIYYIKLYLRLQNNKRTLPE